MSNHRDQTRGAEYFVEYFAEMERAQITLGGAEGKLAQIAALINRLSLVSAGYSTGATRAEVCASVEDIVQDLPEALADQPLSLGDSIPLAALAYLCDVEDRGERLHRYMVLPADHTRRSRIVDLLLGDDLAWDPSQYQGVQLPKTVSENFWAVAEAGRSRSSNASELLEQFVSKHWYRSWKAAGWWGSHLNDDHNVYSGYWAFEAAALAKMFNLDDSALQQHKHYPYDLVHY